MHDLPLGLRCSTTVEAVQAGAEMGAGLVMLTHFSQRYPKIPKIDPQFSATTGVACDYMTVGTWLIGSNRNGGQAVLANTLAVPRYTDLDALGAIPRLTGPLKAVFAEAHADLFDDKDAALAP
jgi:hypothetical protein